MPGRSVTRQLHTCRLTVPAGTTAAAPATAVCDVGHVELSEVEVVVPSGHVGLTGFALAYANQRIVPWAGDLGWLVADDDKVTVPVGIEVSAPVVLQGYNLDAYDHSFYVRLTVDVLGIGIPERSAIGALEL